jgi:hypothetical protein
MITSENVLCDVLTAVAKDRPFEDVLSLAMSASGRNPDVIDGALRLASQARPRTRDDGSSYTRAQNVLTFARRLCNTQH